MAWTSPRTWVASEVVTAALLNTHVRDNLKAVGDAWTSYTPTYTNFTLGNGTVSAFYQSAGKQTMYRGLITLGTTSSVTGNIRISLPATAGFSGFGYPFAGAVSILDTSASLRWVRFPLLQSSTEFYIGDATDTRTSATAPMTWATGDTISWQFVYEAA